MNIVPKSKWDTENHSLDLCLSIQQNFYFKLKQNICFYEIHT